MNKRATGSQYALGGTPIVDVRIGDAFPIVEEVYRYLDQLNYLAENAEKLVSKQIEFRANVEEETLEWRYENEDWIVLASFSELLKIDINSIEKIVQAELNAKQNTLVSGTNIKTINGQSLLGGGNLVVVGGDGIPDAPADGKTYGREDASWVEINKGGAAGDAASISFVQSGTDAVPTDVQTKLGAIVTPEDFGAKGDFSTDDYLPLQRAFNYLNSIGGGVLYARNKYSVSTQLHTYSNITLDMCGTGYIRRDFNTSPKGAALLGSYPHLGGGANIKILNGTLDGNGQNYAQAHNIMNLEGNTNILVENVKFLNVVDFHAIDGGDCKRMTIRNCEFLGFHVKTTERRYSEAIQTDAGVEGLIEDWVIDGCYFGANPLNLDPNFGAWPVSVGRHASSAGAVVRRVVISNNTFNGLTYAGVRPFGWDDVVIKGNHFNNCEVAVLTSMSTRDSRACNNVVISDNTFSGGGANCIFIDDDGENTVPTNGLIITGNTFTNVQVAMRLQCARNFTVSGNKSQSSITFVNLSACSNGAISNNVTNGTANVGVYMSAVPSKSIAVSDNTFSATSGRAVHINVAVENVTVSGNLVVDCSGKAAIAADSGAKNVSIQNNTIVSGDLGLVPETSAIATTSTVINPVVTDNTIGAGIPNPVVNSASGGGTFKGSCTGSPEGFISAPVGSLVLRKDGGDGSTMYVKESGTDNTGWVAKSAGGGGSSLPGLDESLAGFFSIFGEYPSRPATEHYSYLGTTYGYSYAYPQGLAIDYEENELWVSLGTNGGVNKWTWWWVLDLDTKAQKALFYTPGSRPAEGFALTREAGTRYLYAPVGDVVAKYALNLLPALYGTVSPSAISADIGVRNIVTKSGDKFLVEVTQRGQQSYKNLFYVLDRSLKVVGTRSIPIYTAGKPTGVGADGGLLKKQGTASYGGGYAHSYGGLYLGTGYMPMYHDIGMAMADSSGTFTSVARFSAVDMLAYFKSRDPSTSRVEAEGAFINSSGRPMTLIMTNPADPHAGGMHLVEFYSDRADAVDMRSSLASMPTVVQTPIWVPERGGKETDLPLLNPLTGERLDSTTKICKYMGETQTSEVRFYTTNFPGIFDNAVGDTLPLSSFVTIQSWNNISFDLVMRTSDRVFRYMYSLTSDTWTAQPSTIRAANTPGTPGKVIGDIAYARDPSAYNSIGWVWTGSPPKWELFGKVGSGGSGLESGGTVTGTLNMSSAPTDKINLGALNLSGSSTYVGFGDSSDPFKVRIYTDGSLTSFGQFLITTGQIRADASYSTTVAESANVNIGAAGYLRRSTSSLRYKDCVEDVEDELMQAVIDEARPIWYRSLCKDDDRDMSWWGLGAEELGAIDPRFVHWAHPIVPTEIVEEIEFYEPTGETDENGNQITKTVTRKERRTENRPDTSQPKQAEGVMYDRLVVPLLWHAKKMQSRIEELEARLAALEPNP